MFSAPIVAADQAMMEQAGKEGGRIALLCTFEGTREISYQLLKLYCELSRKSYEIVPFVLKEAYEEAQKSNLEVHNQMIREKSRGITTKLFWPRCLWLTVQPVWKPGGPEFLQAQLRHMRQ